VCALTTRKRVSNWAIVQRKKIHTNKKYRINQISKIPLLSTRNTRKTEPNTPNRTKLEKKATVTNKSTNQQINNKAKQLHRQQTL